MLGVKILYWFSLIPVFKHYILQIRVVMAKLLKKSQFIYYLLLGLSLITCYPIKIIQPQLDSENQVVFYLGVPDLDATLKCTLDIQFLKVNIYDLVAMHAIESKPVGEIQKSSHLNSELSFIESIAINQDGNVSIQNLDDILRIRNEENVNMISNAIVNDFANLNPDLVLEQKLTFQNDENLQLMITTPVYEDENTYDLPITQPLINSKHINNDEIVFSEVLWSSQAEIQATEETSNKNEDFLSSKISESDNDDDYYFSNTNYFETNYEDHTKYDVLYSDEEKSITEQYLYTLFTLNTEKNVEAQTEYLTIFDKDLSTESSSKIQPVENFEQPQTNETKYQSKNDIKENSTQLEFNVTSNSSQVMTRETKMDLDINELKTAGQKLENYKNNYKTIDEIIDDLKTRIKTYEKLISGQIQADNLSRFFRFQLKNGLTFDVKCDYIFASEIALNGSKNQKISIKCTEFAVLEEKDTFLGDARAEPYKDSIFNQGTQLLDTQGMVQVLKSDFD